MDDVSPWLVEAVDVAVAAARDTGGLVDPTMGRLICDLGYDDDLDEVRARPAPVAMGPAGPARAAADHRGLATSGHRTGPGHGAGRQRA